MWSVLLLITLGLTQGADPVVHSVCDISQEFTFYMDGRFHRQYLEEVGKDQRNWGTLSKLDLSNVNLLVLTGGNHHIPYSEASLDHLESYVQEGGGILIMADGGESPPPVAPLVERFGAELSEARATKPLAGAGELEQVDITFRGGRTLQLPEGWEILLEDKTGLPVLATRSWGRGHVLLGSRGLFGQRPDAADPINAEWITPLLVRLATHKVIDPKKPHPRQWAELKEQIGPLTLEFHEGTQPFAAKIVEEYLLVRPHLVDLTGVEPSPGMIKRLLILPTGGGGFSSGVVIAIGAFWGNYPERRYPMVELISHEAGHSWVLPNAEPLWNEPIATYLGIQVGKRLEMEEAQQTLDRAIAKGRKHDPDFTQIDPLGEGAPRDLIWGKSYFVFEELERLHGPAAMAKYFKAKRRIAGENLAQYTMDDCVFVWSEAVGKDLFPWFRSLAFDVDRSRSQLGTTR